MHHSPAPPTRNAVLSLFRAVVHTARAFPDHSIGSKLLFNARELIRLRRGERDAAVVRRHVADGYQALRVYDLLRRDESLLTAITRKKPPTSC